MCTIPGLQLALTPSLTLGTLDQVCLLSIQCSHDEGGGRGGKVHTMEATVSKLNDGAIVCMPETVVPGLDGGAMSDGEGMSGGKLAT